MGLNELFLRLKGSAGSGNFSHDGRPGKLGGSGLGGGLGRLQLDSDSTAVHRKGVAAMGRHRKTFLKNDPKFRKSLEKQTSDICSDSPPRCESLTAYTSDDYAPINKFLRGQNDYISDGHRKDMKNIDMAFSNATPLKKSIVVGRNMQADDINHFNLKPGDIFQDNAYVSTDYASSNLSRLEIFVPKGAKGLYIDQISDHEGEREFLLPRETKFKVLDTSPGHLKLEVIIDNAPRKRKL